MSTTILEAKNLTAGYIKGIPILNDCSLKLEKNELVGVIGPNGAGKSTLIKAMFGLLSVWDGNVHLEGEDITNMPSHKLVARGVGYVPQVKNVFESLTVEDNLKMGAYLDSSRVKDRMEELSDLFPLLSERRNAKAGTLSGGERQMVAIARAMMMYPDVLLLDEPSAGLSPANQDATFARIREVVESGVSIVIVEQNASTCLQICDRGYVLDEGKDAYTDTGKNLLNNPKVVELYLGSLSR